MIPVWNCCILSTGETPIVSNSAGAGAYNRVIEVEVASGEYIIRDGRRIAETIKANYGFAGKEFVQRLYDSSETRENICARYDQNLNAFLGMKATDKQAMAAAMLMTADELATEWIFEDGNCLSKEEIMAHLLTKEDVSAGRRAYEWLCGWVVSNINHFYRGMTVPQGATYGQIDGDVAYVIRSVLNQALQNAGYSVNATLSYLRANNLIATRDRKGYTKAKRIGGIATDCVWLYYQIREDNRRPD